MKYIITESQYNKAIDKFISSQFNNFEKKKNRKYRDSIFWVKNGEVIAEIKGSDFFYIKGDLWDLISKLVLSKLSLIEKSLLVTGESLIAFSKTLRFISP